MNLSFIQEFTPGSWKLGMEGEGKIINLKIKTLGQVVGPAGLDCCLKIKWFHYHLFYLTNWQELTRDSFLLKNRAGTPGAHRLAMVGAAREMTRTLRCAVSHLKGLENRMNSWQELTCISHMLNFLNKSRYFLKFVCTNSCSFPRDGLICFLFET